METKVFKIVFIFLVLAVPICYAPLLISHHAAKEEASVRFESSQAMERIFFYARNADGILPDDVCDPTGEPILSWRTVVSDELSIPIPPEEQSDVDPRAPWDSPENLKAAKKKPVRFNYPQKNDRSDSTLTRVLRVREVHDRLKEIALRRDPAAVDAPSLDRALINVPYLVLVESEHAVPWTSPRDLSWRDLVDGRVKLTTDSKNRIWYLATCGLVCLQPSPQSQKEWERLFAPAISPDKDGAAREEETVTEPSSGE